MPTPIQSSSITAKLRSFFRLRGRQIFTLDETSVPTVQVEDLTDAPYRAGHQIRWMTGDIFTPDVIALRNFLIIVNTASLGLITLGRVPGVAVVEKMSIRQSGIAPTDAQRWDVNLTSHGGLIGQFDAGTAVTPPRAANVDAPFNPTGTNVVQGQVPVQLIGAAEVAVPAFGTQLTLGEINPQLDEEFDVLGGAHVVIGDNVALTLINRSVATAGFLWVNVVGSYYPLARS